MHVWLSPFSMDIHRIKVRLICVASSCVLFAAIGCKTSSRSTPQTGSKPTQIEAEHDATLPKANVKILPNGGAALDVTAEIADTDATRERGLMYRKQLGAFDGMLFIYPAPAHLVFWMKNTYIPLDMIFIGADGRVVGVVENAQPLTETQREVDGISQYVLEVNGGFAAKYSIGPGTRVELPADLVSRTATALTDKPESAKKSVDMKRSPSSPDPEKGKFTLTEATKGLPAGNQLKATIVTSLGTLNCTLDAKNAPNTVANFVGLARGIRPWWDTKSGEWVKRPVYDGSTFHRVIPGFMIQGGDPLGDGTGEVGYVIDDEIYAGAKHDRAGLMCMANRGPNTNGCQFFITDAATPHLDGGYTIFGLCEPIDVISKIARVPKSPANDRPHEPVKIEKITIHR